MNLHSFNAGALTIMTFDFFLDCRFVPAAICAIILTLSVMCALLDKQKATQ